MDDTACSACGAETLLFECSQCGRAYCSDHERPYHACTASSTTNDLVAAGFVPLSEAADASETATTTTTETTAESGEPTTVSGDAGTVEVVSVGPNARDAARETRPDSERRWPTPEVRGHPADRDETQTLEEWFRQQSIVGYTLKIAMLALLFNSAYFLSLAAVL